MSDLEHLIAADRVVLAGLSAYDTMMANAWTTAADAMAKGCVPAEQIEAAREFHEERALAHRGDLHRELWTKALAMIALEAPDAGTV